MLDIIIDPIGYAGPVLLLIAYGWASRYAGASDRLGFHLLSIFGSLGVVSNSIYYAAMPSVALNIVYIMMGFLALTRLARSRARTRSIASAPADMPPAASGQAAPETKTASK